MAPTALTRTIEGVGPGTRDFSRPLESRSQGGNYSGLLTLSAAIKTIFTLLTSLLVFPFFILMEGIVVEP